MSLPGRQRLTVCILIQDCPRAGLPLRPGCLAGAAPRPRAPGWLRNRGWEIVVGESWLENMAMPDRRGVRCDVQRITGNTDSATRRKTRKGNRSASRAPDRLRLGCTEAQKGTVARFDHGCAIAMLEYNRFVSRCRARADGFIAPETLAYSRSQPSPGEILQSLVESPDPRGHASQEPFERRGSDGVCGREYKKKLLCQ